MKKYLAFTSIAWQQTLTYRAESAMWFVLELFPTFVFISLWFSLYSSGRLDIDRLSNLVLYYFLTLIISRLTSVHFEDWCIEDVKDGRVSFHLLKPFSYITSLFFQEITWRISGLIFLIPTLLVLIPVLSRLNLPSPSAITIIIFIILLLIGYILRFFIAILIVLSAFWIEQAKSLVHLKWMLEGVFGGAWLPLTFFPIIWQKLAFFSPFYVQYYFPAEVFLGSLSMSAIWQGMAISVVWIVILYFTIRFVWWRSVNKYSAVGG